MKKKKKNTGIIILLIAIIALSYYFFFTGNYSMIRLMEERKSYEETRSEVEELNTRIKEQKKENELLKEQDPFEMEKKAREKGMVKEGETIYKYEIEKEN